MLIRNAMERDAATRRPQLLATTAVGLLAVVMFSSVVDPAAHAADTGVYSNVRIVGEDVIGYELFVIKSRTGVFVLLQANEGVPLEPCLLQAELSGKELAFRLSPPCASAGKFVGTFRGKDLVGRFDNGWVGPDGKTEMRLVRRPSYWQR